ncbi:MAG: glutathione-disulfide reductase [Pseudomonadota bacterium]|nr:glutathione-disulfide reductase [Pseudomonadota bacterium]
MVKYDFDLITIGAGSGGVRAARMAAGGHGKRVAIVENLRTGGTCVMRGCVPKKLLVYSAHFGHDFEDSAGYGWMQGEPVFNWPILIANKNAELERLESVYHRLLRNAGVTEIAGTGRLADAHTVEVDGKSLTTETILIATGGWPTMPQIPGIEHVITSNEALDLDALPKHIVIVGGGYIAVEFAGIFNALGTEVHEIIRADMILRGFDEDIRESLRDEMTAKQIKFHSGTKVERIEKTNQGFTVNLNASEAIATELVMYATGRTPNSRGIGLGEVGAEIDDKGAVVVDAYSRTTVDNIYAIGDVTNRMNLTPVAIEEAMAFVNTVYGGEPTAMDYVNVPSAVFSQPPVGTVGLTEDQARERGAIDVYMSNFRPMKYTLSGRDESSMMKIIVDRASDRVLGCHMVGVDAPEIIQGISIALKAGATKAQFDATVGIHPTAAEEFVTTHKKLPDDD